MVFDIILLVVALVGSTAAAIYDLKTTEVPDWLFYIMAAVGIPVLVTQAFVLNDFSILQNAAVISVGLLVFGFLMYKTGQWGGADALLVALIGLLVSKLPTGFSPNLILPLPLSFLLNVFILGTVYMVIYAVIFAYRNKIILRNYFKEVKASARILVIFSSILFTFLIFLSIYLNNVFYLGMDIPQVFRTAFVPIAFTLSLIFFYRFAKIVEKFGFRKRIPVSKVRVGDMLLTKKELVGITSEQLYKLKKSEKKFVWIKEGVRFAPAFPIALLYTLYFGDAILVLTLLI